MTVSFYNWKRVPFNSLYAVGPPAPTSGSYRSVVYTCITGKEILTFLLFGGLAFMGEKGRGFCCLCSQVVLLFCFNTFTIFSLAFLVLLIFFFFFTSSTFEVSSPISDLLTSWSLGMGPQGRGRQPGSVIHQTRLKASISPHPQVRRSSIPWGSSGFQRNH